MTGVPVPTPTRTRRSSPRRARKAYEQLFAEDSRRVMVCARCDRVEPWHGFLRALGAGWAWTWLRGRLVFLCTDPTCTKETT